MNDKRKPIKAFRHPLAGGVQVAVWEKEGKRTISLQRSFKNQDGEWKRETLYVFPNEAVAIAGAVSAAVAWMGENPPAKDSTNIHGSLAASASQELTFDDDEVPF